MDLVGKGVGWVSFVMGEIWMAKFNDSRVYVDLWRGVLLATSARD